MSSALFTSLYTCSENIKSAVEAKNSADWKLAIEEVKHIPSMLSKLRNVTLQLLQTSGLVLSVKKLHQINANLMLEAPPKTDLAKAQSSSFQSFHLADRLVQQLDAWRMAWPGQAPMTLPCSPMTGGSPASQEDATQLLHYFLNGTLQIPHQVDLNALFFLTTQFNFAHHWVLWISPSLMLICPQGSSLLKCDPQSLYAQVMRQTEFPIHPTDDGALFAEVWERSKAVRNFTRQSKRPCKCEAEGVTLHQCRRTIHVTKPVDVPPLGSTLLEPSVAEMVDQDLWHVLEPDSTQKGFRHSIKFRDRVTNELGGLVVFNAFTDDALRDLCDNWDYIRTRASVTPRSVRKHPYALQSGQALAMEHPERMLGHEKPIVVDLKVPRSDMRGAGKRHPTGGVAGDTYNHYAWMGSETAENRDAIFRYIQDVAVAMNVFSTRDNATREAVEFLRLEREPGSGFGRFDMAAFYAFNDSTSQHVDRDAAWTIAVTFQKQNAPGLAGSFAWSEWGVVVNAPGNTAWIFDSSKVHGKVHPISHSEDKIVPGWDPNFSDKGMASDGVAESLLGLQRLPWCYYGDSLPVKESLDLLGLLSSYHMEYQEELVVPNKMAKQESGEWGVCSERKWAERQSLAYFINLHILSKGNCGNADVSNDIGAMLKDPWYPGAMISRLNPRLPSDPDIKQKPYNPHETFLLQPHDGSPKRMLLPTDTKLCDYDDAWEIYPRTLKATTFLEGRTHWIKAVDMHWKAWWSKIASSIQKACSLTHHDIWCQNHPTPDKLTKNSQPKLTDGDYETFHAALMGHLGVSIDGLGRATRNCARRLLECIWNNESRKFKRTLNTWEKARQQVDKELEHLESLKSPAEEDLPADWMPSLLNLRESEEKLFGCYSSIQQKYIDNLNKVLCVGSHVATHPSKHSAAARSIPSTQLDITKFKTLMDEFWMNLPDGFQAIEDDSAGRPQPDIDSLEKLKEFLHCSEANLLPGMKPDSPGLRFHQLHAITWLARKLAAVNGVEALQNTTSKPLGAGFLIADAPGLGKTLIVLGLLAYLSNWSSSRVRKEKMMGVTSLDDLSGPVVIACPGLIQSQWQTEAKKWIPAGAWEFLLYPKSAQDLSYWWSNVYNKSMMPVHRRVVIISHTMLASEYKHQSSTGNTIISSLISIFDVSPWLVVVDEAHMARNAGTKIFKALTMLSNFSMCRILLTATPIHNHVENILSLMQLMSISFSAREATIIKQLRTLLPVFRGKARKYLHAKVITAANENSLQTLSVDDSSLTDQIGFGKEFLERTVSIIKYIMRGHYIRRDHHSLDWEKKPLVGLPPKTTFTVGIVLTKGEREWYESERNSTKQVLASSGGGNPKNFWANERRGLIHRAAYLFTSAGMASWLREKDEVATMIHNAYMSMLSTEGHELTPSSKLQKVVELLQKILVEDEDKSNADKRKILVYCAWPSLWPVVQAYLKHHGIYTICIADSGLGVRDRLIAEFQQEDAHMVGHNESYVAIMSAAVGTGVNLTRASVIIMMDRTWSHQDTLQVHGRAHRFGQGREVVIYNLIAINTIDEDLMELSTAKGALMEMFSLDGDDQDTSIPTLPESDGIPQSPTKPARRRQTREQQVSLRDADFERRRTRLMEYVQEFQTSHMHCSQEPVTANQADLTRRHQEANIQLTASESAADDVSLPCTTAADGQGSVTISENANSIQVYEAGWHDEPLPNQESTPLENTGFAPFPMPLNTQGSGTASKTLIDKVLLPSTGIVGGKVDVTITWNTPPIQGDEPVWSKGVPPNGQSMQFEDASGASPLSSSHDTPGSLHHDNGISYSTGSPTPLSPPPSPQNQAESRSCALPTQALVDSNISKAALQTLRVRVAGVNQALALQAIPIGPQAVFRDRHATKELASSEDTSDEEVDLKAQKFHTISKSSKKVTVQSHQSTAAKATQSRGFIEQVVPQIAGKGGSGLKVNKRRALQSEDGPCVDSGVGSEQKPRKRRKKVVKLEYDSEDDIEERNRSLKNLFS